VVEEAEKYKGKIHDAANLHDINFSFFQLRVRLQLLVSLRRMASNLTHTTFVNSLTDVKLADEFSAAGKSELETAINETIKWLNPLRKVRKRNIYIYITKGIRSNCEVGILFLFELVAYVLL
jgi:hypothetical protein